MMRIVLLNRYRLVNGTQTMILRIARSLREKGHEPIFVRFNDRPVALLDEIARYAQIVYFHDLLAEDSVKRIGAIDVIYCFTADTLIEVLHRKGALCKKVVFGLYHPRQYRVVVRFWDSFINKLYRKIFAAYPKNNIVFMNEEVREACEIDFKMSMVEASILPLPIDVGQNNSLKRSIDRYKIVSIGRLVEFKNYHAPVIEFVARQRAQGSAYEYHIYGDGPMRPNIEDMIVAHGMQKYITLHGTLPYKQLPAVLRGAAIMIGMGTAMVEAAASRIPVIAAIDMQGELCHGWFHQTKGYCLGEATEHLPCEPIIAKLDEYSKWSDEEYYNAAQQSWVRANDFSTSKVVDDFLKILENAATTEGIVVTQWEWIRYWASKAYARYFTRPGWKHK